jgi:putative serine protease PepD
LSESDRARPAPDGARTAPLPASPPAGSGPGVYGPPERSARYGPQPQYGPQRQYGPQTRYGQPQFGADAGAPGPGQPGQPGSPPQWQHLGSPLRGPDYLPQGGPPGGPNSTVAFAPPPAPSRQGRFNRDLVVLLLLAGLIGGAVGGLGGTVYERSRGQNTAAGRLPAGPLLSTGAPSPVDNSPNSVSTIAARLLPSVVTIRVSGSGVTGTGSGVIIRPDGFILTNNHVVTDAATGGTVRVDLYKGRRDVEATIVGRDPKTDLAVIRIDASGLPAATLGQSKSLVVGAPVVALGAPLGLSSTVTAGIVSALDRNVDVPDENGDSGLLIGAIQTDAAINPGNSGGPLVDSAGQVVGINSAIATAPGTTGSGGSIGVGFAIPIDYARSIAEEIIRTGKATHPYLGVTASTVERDSSGGVGAGGVSPVPGALIQSVVPGGPADRASLRPGDVITKVNDTNVEGVDDLVAATRLHKVGDVVTVTYERAGSQTVSVTLQESKG